MSSSSRDRVRFPVVRRVLANALLFYALAAVATFAFYFVAQVRSPSQYYPYFGQGLTAAWWVTAWLLIGSPVVLLALAVVDELAGHVANQRRFVLSLGLLPAVIGAAIALAYPEAWPAVLWLALVGASVARLLRLPPPTKTASASVELPN